MIIDGHAYCFPPRDEAAGYSSVEEKWLEFQREMSGHHQPVWRVRDRAPADNSTLIDPETRELHDVQFTVHRNRITWDYEGETYTKQYYPPMLYRGDARLSSWSPRWTMRASTLPCSTLPPSSADSTTTWRMPIANIPTGSSGW